VSVDAANRQHLRAVDGSGVVKPPSYWREFFAAVGATLLLAAGIAWLAWKAIEALS
jgi:hypothetical protein